MKRGEIDFDHFPLQCFLVTNVSRRSRKCISSVSPWELIFIYTWPTSEEGGKVSTWTWLEVWLRQDYRNCCVPTHQPDVCLLGLEGPVLAAVHSSHSVSTDVCHIKMNHFFFFSVVHLVFHWLFWISWYCISPWFSLDRAKENSSRRGQLGLHHMTECMLLPLYSSQPHCMLSDSSSTDLISPLTLL